MRRLLTLVLLFALAGPVAADNPEVLDRIAFGSCARQDRPQPVWEAVVATRPDLFLFIGDNIYADTKDMAVMKAKYDELAAVKGYQKLLKTAPVLATWDDHDYGWNDAGVEFPHKEESQRIFLDFFKVPKDSPRRQRPGIYHAELFGPPEKRVQVIVLDTRYFRSPLKKKAGKLAPGEGPYLADPDPDVTMLGEEQWRWLGEQLKVPAKLRVIASSVQVVPEDHAWEKWMNMPRERDRLFKLLRETGAEGVVFISGDRHLAELSVMDASVGYPLFDLTSSGLNQGAPKWRKLETNRHRVATMNHGNNFGLITVDWERKDPLVSLQIRSEAGDVMIQEKVPLSLLRPGTLKGKAAAGPVKLDGEQLTAQRVKQRLKKNVTVELRVAATGASAGNKLVFLNSADRSSPENFTVVLDKKAQESLRQAGVADPRGHFEGKTIRVIGTLSLFNDRPQVIVSDAKQVEVVGR